jgi:integrase/recombinase XerD
LRLEVTLATVSTEFFERPGLAKSTRYTYELVLLPLLQEYGSWSIAIISRQTLIEYLNSLSELSWTTHHKHQAILQSLFNFAVEQGYIKFNPIHGLKQRKPSQEKGEHKTDTTVRFLTQPQLKLLYYAVAKDLRMNAIVHLLHRTGCRVAELLNLNLSDVDFNSQKFQVIGKGNKQRWCFYSNDAADSLDKYLSLSRLKNHNALFTAQHPGTLKVSRISYSTVYKDWRQLIEPYPQIHGVKIHDLRHTFATERVGLLNIEELRALMGHENIQTTLIYQKVTSQKAEESARKAFNSLLDTH